MKRILGCFIIFIIMMTSQIFAGTVYYIDATNGNDLNDGLSEVSAWKSIAKVNAQSFSPGDFILFKRGEIWRETLIVPSSGNAGNQIIFSAYGSGPRPVIYGSDLMTGWVHDSGNIWKKTNVTTEPYVVIFSGTWGEYKSGGKGSLDTNNEWHWDSGDYSLYVYTDGGDPDTQWSSGINVGQRNGGISIALRDYININNIDIRYVNRAGISGNSSDYCEIDNCNIKMGAKNGIWFFACTNNTIKNCTINYFATGIGIEAGSDNNTFEYNDLSESRANKRGAGGGGILLYDSDSNIIRYNYIHDAKLVGSGRQGDGIYLSIGGDCNSNEIYYNIIATHNDGIDICGDGNKIYNNIFYKNYYPQYWIGSGASNCVIKNNIFYDGIANNFLNHGDEPATGNTIDYNCYYDPDNPSPSNGTVIIWTITGQEEWGIMTWSTWVGKGKYDQNSIYADPRFEDAENGDFRLQSSSTCIDAGTYVGLTQDYAENTVPYGLEVDIGAHEYTPLNAEINASPTSGEVPLSVNFTAGATGGAPPYTYSWNFGDDTSSSEQNPSHTYSDAGDYTVTLTVTDSENNQDDESLTINVSAPIPPLEASCAASPTSGEAPLTVNFTGNATGGAPPYTYSWNFGDDTSSTEQNPTHTYNDAGDYTVTLTITDDENNQDEDSLIINASAPVIPLEASCAASSTSGEVPLTVNFTGGATGGTPPYSHSWNFGDDTSSSEQNPSHTYSEAGDYTVTLTVTDSQSSQDSESLTINASVAIPPYLYCSPKSLYFGATTSGNETSDQHLRIINAGIGILTWNIEDNAAWLSCSPLSGTDRGKTTVSVNASGLSLGLHTATITVSSPEAYNSPQYVSVNLSVYESEQESPPFGILDTPVDGSIVSGSVPVTGWALDDIEVTRVEIKRNSDPVDPPEAIGQDGLVCVGDAVFVKGARPDIENTYPDYPLNSRRAGWGYTLLTNDLPYRGNGSFTIYVFAYDASGHREDIGRKTILCDNANCVKPFGTIDTPGQGESTSGSDYINFGWALTPLPKTIPKDGSTIWVWVDGVQIGHPVYDQYRGDIATLYPEYNNAQGALGYYYLDTTQYENGMHTITWSAMDDGGEVEGISTKYFSIYNIETGNDHPGPFVFKRIYLEDIEGKLRIGIREVRKGYSLQVDNEMEIIEKSIFKILPKEKLTRRRHSVQIDNKRRIDRKNILKIQILKIQIEEMEPLRIALEESSSGNMEYIGWGENKWKALPIGSTLDREKGIFSWIPTPGFLGRYELYFAVTDGYYMSKPLRVLLNVIPKSYD